MKRKNREINIFSMSALDLFASAMGAFLLIAVIALPYYLHVDRKIVDQLKKDLKKSESQRKELKKEKEELEKANKKMQDELLKTFCVINMKWKNSTKVDIDLHIVDPDGDEYYFSKMSYPGKSAFFAVDSVGVKRGAEVWMDKQLKPGKYKIYYVYYKGRGSVQVKSSVYTKSFTKDLPTKTLYTSNSKNKILVATINVDSAGNATLEPN